MKRIPIFITLVGLFTSLVFAEQKPVTSMDEALAMPTSLNVKSESFDSLTRRLAKQVQRSVPKESSFNFDIKLLAADLKLDGITRNQRIGKLELSDQPLSKVLTAVVQKANGHQVKDPSDPGQRIVWVVGTDPDDAQRELILITTRMMAEKRSYKLPDVFIAKKKSL